ncbi:hypothetical protein ALQ95_200047 [Pseudomonas syringae pv. ribicola]|uniref:Uncharacterized protein n=1 Tax=Pseudomonas syringae pv. ribicola TaxID=55398 RepID=A0A3M2VV38_PSESI|nr:hypothetical protein ALQ95_200047 [Pseudomonas syringae pv. ribicola]
MNRKFSLPSVIKKAPTLTSSVRAYLIKHLLRLFQRLSGAGAATTLSDYGHVKHQLKAG